MEKSRVCLSFAGVAGNLIFHLGAAEELLKLAGDREIVYAGTSSGSVVASFLAMGFQPLTAKERFKEFLQTFNRWYETPLTHWFLKTREQYLKYLQPDTYLQVSGRLYIGYSELTLSGLQSRVISTYTSNEDLVNAIFASCHLFPYKKFPFCRFRGAWCTDGAFSKPVIKPVGIPTVSISSRMVYYETFYLDWLPSTCLHKVDRHFSIGQGYVQRHREFFLAAIEDRSLAQLSFPQPTRYFTWLFLLFCLWRLGKFLTLRKLLWSLVLHQ